MYNGKEHGACKGYQPEKMKNMQNIYIFMFDKCLKSLKTAKPDKWWLKLQNMI